MEPEAEDPENTWSGSNVSQELCVSESLAEPQDEVDISTECTVDPYASHIPNSDPESCPSQDWESAGEQQSPLDLSGSEEDVMYEEEDEMDLSDVRGSVMESPHIQSSPESVSPHQEQSDSESHTEHMSEIHTLSSSSSLGRAADTTLALTPATEDPLGSSDWQEPGTGSRRVESSEEGGSSEAPPASVFFEISDEGAEQAEERNSGSDSDLCRPDRRRGRGTRLSRSESQSERQVKETKSKCKRLARLLTDAPNPRNKGALLFEKRRQRVKKYTFVSYGTGQTFDYKDQTEEEAEEVRSAGYNFVSTSDSELEEDFFLYHQQHSLSRNYWESVREMEALPETKGKGVLMFAQRRKRVDDILSEHEEMRSKGLPVEALTGPQYLQSQNIYNTKEMHKHTDQANYMDARHTQHEYQEYIQQTNHLANVPSPLVPNRTAKPFMGFQDGTAAPVIPGGVVPATKKNEPRFKVPVPTNINPHVWSPTGEILASRDERISVPAIKTGILPESKRKTTNKPSSARGQKSDLQSKGERRSFIESEEDCFSLGAEACNFMQPRSIKLKHPPPVAPKPTINPACPPWMRKSPSGELHIPPRSPGSQPSPSSRGPHGQPYLNQQDWAQPQQLVTRYTPEQTQATLQAPASAWAPISSSSHLRSPVSIQAQSPSLPSRNKPDSVPNSVASCPPQVGKSYVLAPKASQGSPEGRVSDRGIYRSGDGPTMAGKGAELFAKRQSRMEKFVVDAETVQANKTRSLSPTSSLPHSWRHSSNVPAPPPLSYNPPVAPFYPPSAAKQPPSTTSKSKPKATEKHKTPPKHLNVLDIMKHQPYHLDSSLFKYDVVPDSKIPSNKATQVSKFEVTKNLKHRVASSHSPYNASGLSVEAEAPSKSPGLVSSPNPSAHQNTKSAEPRTVGKHVVDKHTAAPAAHHITGKLAPGATPSSRATQQSSTAGSIASAFSPASLIARGVRQMAPRPKFSAKKPAMASKQWKPVAMLH